MSKYLWEYILEMADKLAVIERVSNPIGVLVRRNAVSEEFLEYMQKYKGDEKKLISGLSDLAEMVTGFRLGEDDSRYALKVMKNYKALSPNTIMKNPYYKAVNVLADVRCGDYSLTRGSMARGEFAMYDSGSFTGMECIPNWGMYTDSVEYPCLQLGGKSWMTITDSEINTMKHSVSRAKGKVLCIGAGLGYYAFMVAQKPEVESVTIVEVSEDVLKLFTEHILPQFPNKEKIKTIHADFFSMPLCDIRNWYDFVFVDIWFGLDDESLKTYLKCKQKLDVLRGHVNISYWLEAALVHRLRLALFCIVMEAPLEDYSGYITEKLLHTVKIKTVSDFELAISGNNVVNWIVSSCEIK